MDAVAVATVDTVQGGGLDSSSQKIGSSTKLAVVTGAVIMLAWCSEMGRVSHVNMG
jgi:hypothetical protein